MFSHHANKDDTRASKALVFMNICIHYRGIIHCGLKCGNKKKSSAIYWSCTFIHNSNFLPKENQNPSSLVSNLRKHIKRCTIPTYSSIQFLNVILVVFLQKNAFIHSFQSFFFSPRIYIYSGVHSLLLQKLVCFGLLGLTRRLTRTFSDASTH